MRKQIPGERCWIEGAEEVDNIEKFIEGLKTPQRLLDIEPDLIPQKKRETFCQIIQNQFDESHPNFGQKILENIRFINERDFKKSVEGIGRRVDAFVGSSPYTTLFTAGSSGQRLYPFLKTRHQPVSKASFADAFRFAQEISRLKANETEKIILIDDVAITGGNLSLTLDRLKNQVDPDRIFLGVVATTREAAQRFVEKYGIKRFYAQFRIDTISDLFTPDELEELSCLVDDQEYRHRGNNILFFIHDRISDMCLPMLYQPIYDYEHNKKEPFTLIDRNAFNERSQRNLLYPESL